MLRIHPSPARDLDPVVEYLDAPRPVGGDRPWLGLGMITSLDGGTAVDGTSGALGGPADKTIFRAVRACADVIIVAAGTIRAETYSPVSLPGALRRMRLDRNMTDVPLLAIVTSSLDFDLDTPLFTDDTTRPIVLTTEDADPDRVDEVAARAPVLQHGTGQVDLHAALERLRADGHRVVISEGGPTLNGALAEIGFDEVFLSIGPAVIGGDSSRIVRGGPTVEAGYTVATIFTEDDLLFCRYVRSADEPTA